MVLRAFALLIGVPLTLLGLLALAVAIGMVGNPGPQGGPPPIAVQLIGVFIMAAVPAMGAMLCWLGLRKRSKPTSADPPVSATNHTAQQFATAGAPQGPTDGPLAATRMSPCVQAARSPVAVATLAPPDDNDGTFGYGDNPGDYDEQSGEAAELPAALDDDQEIFQIGSIGRLVGKCGPKMSGQSHYHLIGGLVIVIGIGVMIGLNVAPGAADPVKAGKLGLGLGGGLILFGGAIIAMQLMRAPQIVSLYDDRLEEESGSKSRTIRLDNIVGLRIQEFYEHRFAPQTFLVTVRLSSQRDLKFSTALGGDADLIVRCLADIAPDVEYRKFMA